MKTPTKLTYKTLGALTLLMTSMVLIIGCGSDNSTSKIEPTTDVVATEPQNNVTTFSSENGVPSALLSQTVNGEYVGIGREYLDQNLLQPTFPSHINWYTRVEFLKNDGSKVDPASFKHPRGGRHYIRLTLENDAQSGVVHSATAKLAVKYRTGSISGGQILTGYDAAGKVAFTISFANSMGMPIPFQLWDHHMTTEVDGGGMIGIATILFEDASGKHQIIY